MRNLATLAVTLALFGGLARAQDKVELKPSYKVGESYTLDMTMSSHMSGSVQGMSLDFKNHSHTAYTDTILEVKDNHPTKVKRTYKADESTQEQTMPGQAPSTHKTTKPYVGKTFTLVKDGDTVKVQETTQVAKELQDSDLEISPKVELLLPDHAVAKGESWSLTKEQLQQLLAQGKKQSIDNVSATCTYEGMVDNNGTQVAKIQVNMTMKGQEQAGGAHQMSMSMTLSGPLLFDPAAGLPVSMNLDGTLTLTRGPMTFQGPMKMQATMTPSK